jgi:hypothetical protein
MSLYLQLLELFLATEEQFSGSGATEQEVIDALRRVRSASTYIC